MRLCAQHISYSNRRFFLGGGGDMGVGVQGEAGGEVAQDDILFIYLRMLLDPKQELVLWNECP